MITQKYELKVITIEEYNTIQCIVERIGLDTFLLIEYNTKNGALNINTYGRRLLFIFREDLKGIRQCIKNFIKESNGKNKI